MGDFVLSVRSVDNAKIGIEQLDCNKESEMLGIWMAPSGEKNHMVAQMREKALEWGARVRLGKASPADSLAALHTTIAMKLKYSLVALTLIEKECNHIMAPAIRAALPKAGFSRSMSSIFRHAPIASLGLNVSDLYTTMGTTRTALLVHHSWKKYPDRTTPSHLHRKPSIGNGTVRLDLDKQIPYLFEMVFRSLLAFPRLSV